MSFWSQAYHIKGGLAHKIKLLAKPDLFKNEGNNFSVFDRYIDVFECAVIVGFKEYNDPQKYAEAMAVLKDDVPSDEAEIPTSTIFKEQNKLKTLFRMVMLNEKIRGLTLEEKVNHAFRNENNVEVQSKNEIFFSTFLELGVNILYKQVMEANNPDDCLDIMREYIQ